ncbi:MAG: RpiB/LacA/LacB family sugar-phosphate isomerase [Candidatus Woesearchaeota archaeon]|jgi:ribose 5-phosphate isomerase B
MQSSVFKRILLASDHAGVEYKAYVMSFLEARLDSFGLDSLIDVGAFNPNIRVDYPDYANFLVRSIKDEETAGILVCARGIGMNIAANRYKHIRAALCSDIRSAFFSRSHSNANVLVLASEADHSKETTNEILKNFLITNFQGGRYQTRLEKLNNFSQDFIDRF